MGEDAMALHSVGMAKGTLIVSGAAPRWEDFGLGWPFMSALRRKQMRGPAAGECPLLRALAAKLSVRLWRTADAPPTAHSGAKNRVPPQGSPPLGFNKGTFAAAMTDLTS
jgi:hypothetical protein